MVERGTAILGEWAAGQIRVCDEVETHVQGKTRAGGQSAPRFRRRREEQLHSHFSRVGERATAVFRDRSEVPAVVAVGGTLATAKKFVDGDYLHHELRDRVEAVEPIEYATERGLTRLGDVAATHLDNQDRERARDRLDEFFDGLSAGTAACGREEVQTALEYNAVDTLLVSEQSDLTGTDVLVVETEQQGGACTHIPPGIPRYKQFQQVTRGVGAVLRYPIK